MTGHGELIIHVAELEALCREAARIPDEMRRILARGRSIKLAGDCPPAELLEIPGPPAAGPLSRLASGMVAEPVRGCWMRVDPVALVPDLTAVWVRGPARLPAGPERERIIRELHALLGDEGMELVWNRDECGLLRVPEVPDCHFFQPWKLPRCRLDEVLPRGTDAGRWCRLINESQMILHQYTPPGAPGQPGLAIWFWGAGELPAGPADALDVEIDAGGSRVLTGLAHWLGKRPVECNEFTVPSGIRMLHWPVRSDQSADVQLESVNQAWLEPAWQAVRRGRLGRLTLAGNARAFAVGPLRAWAFWRGPARMPA